MEEAIEKLLITIEQGIQLVWKGKNHMEIRGIDHFGPAFIHPDFLIDGLTAWTVTVPAGIVMEFQMPAAGAEGDVGAEPAGFAVKDSPGSFPLGIRLKMPGGTEVLIGIVPNLPDFHVTHGKHLPSGRKV